MQQSDKQCLVTCRSQLSAGQERQEGLIAKVACLEQAQAALQADAAAGAASCFVNVPLSGQVCSVPLAVMQQHKAMHHVLTVTQMPIVPATIHFQHCLYVLTAHFVYTWVLWFAHSVRSCCRHAHSLATKLVSERM